MEQAAPRENIVHRICKLILSVSSKAPAKEVSMSFILTKEVQLLHNVLPPVGSEGEIRGASLFRPTNCTFNRIYATTVRIN